MQRLQAAGVARRKVVSRHKPSARCDPLPGINTSLTDVRLARSRFEAVPEVHAAARAVGMVRPVVFSFDASDWWGTAVVELLAATPVAGRVLRSVHERDGGSVPGSRVVITLAVPYDSAARFLPAIFANLAGRTLRPPADGEMVVVLAGDVAQVVWRSTARG